MRKLPFVSSSVRRRYVASNKNHRVDYYLEKNLFLLQYSLYLSTVQSEFLVCIRIIWHDSDSPEEEEEEEEEKQVLVFLVEIFSQSI